MSLQETRKEIIDAIEENLSVLVASIPISEIGEILERLVIQFEALGICNLLDSLDNEEFCRNLIMGAYGRLFFLRKSRHLGNADDLHLAISRTDALFAAITAGDLNLARSIVLLSPTDWIADGEYEDDFCYYAFLHQYIMDFANTDKEKLQQILDRFEKALEGAPSDRLDLCQALNQGDKF